MRDIYYVWAEGRLATAAVASGEIYLHGLDRHLTLPAARRQAARDAARYGWGGHTIVRIDGAGTGAPVAVERYPADEEPGDG